MLRVCFSLFITGIILGSGPCLASCGPILISYVAGTKRTLSGGLWGWFVFSAGRIFAYIFLGFIAGIAGAGLFNRFYWEAPGYIIWFLGGLFIMFLATLIFLGRLTHPKICQILNSNLIEKDTKTLLVLGLLIGIFPCVPLVGILSYITMLSTHFSQGVLMGAAFGLGTVVSPLVFLSMIAGSIPRFKILRQDKNLMIFQRICAAVLFILGLHIVIRTLTEYIKRL